MSTRNVFNFWCFLALLNFGLNFSARAEGECTSLANLLLQEGSGLSEHLASKGFEQTVAGRVEGYVHRSLDSLGESILPASTIFRLLQREFERGKRDLAIHYLRSLKVTPADEMYRSRLVSLLDRDVATFSWQDWVDAVDGLVYLGGRYGASDRSSLLACSICVDTSLHQHGYKFALKDVRNLRVQKVLEHTVPTSHQEIDRHILDWIRVLGLGHFHASARILVAPEERRSLAVFLAMAFESSPANLKERELIDAIVEVSRRPDGRVRLVDAKNFHRLWTLLGGQDAIIEGGDTSGNALVESWTMVLAETAAKARGKTYKGHAFRRAIRDFAEKAKGNSQLRGHLKVFEAQKHYLFPFQGKVFEKLRAPYRGDGSAR